MDNRGKQIAELYAQAIAEVDAEDNQIYRYENTFSGPRWLKFGQLLDIIAYEYPELNLTYYKQGLIKETYYFKMKGPKKLIDTAEDRIDTALRDAGIIY